MADKYVAFLSYAHRDKPWVETLQKNLELCLVAAGRPGKVFLDDVDLASGRSWVGQLQAGLDRSDQLILVATPEAFASPRVAEEWRSFVAGRADWHLGRLHIVRLIDVPFPPFLGQIQSVDFRNFGEDRYRLGLQKLVSGLLGETDGRELPTLPTEIQIPAPPTGRLDLDLRSRLVDWLTPVLASKLSRLAVAQALHLEPGGLEGQDSWASAASAALVWASRQEEPITAALRIVETLEETFREDAPERVAALVPLRVQLEARRAESPDLSLLSTWLNYVARDHEHLVPLQGQVALTLLDRVYVQLAVRPDFRRTGDPAGPGRLDQTPTLLDLLALDRAAHPWVTGRWVVLGDPGAGKTTLLRHLTSALARREDRLWVPLFESLPRLLKGRASLLGRAVRRLELAGHPAQGLAEALDRAGLAGRLLLLLDGLDEVPKESRDEAEQLLRDLAVRWPDSPLVVTSRPIGYRSPGSGFREVDLLPLYRDRRHELLARWFGRSSGTPDKVRADRALAALDAPELQDIAGNPLYLTLMALLFEQEIAPDHNRTRLYDQVFDLLLEGKHRPDVRPMERKGTVRALLRRLAFGMTESNRDAEPVGMLEDRLYRPEIDPLRDQLERAGWRGRLRSFLDELAEKTGILGPHDGPDADWRFWHRTFREALTAESLQDQLQEKGGRAAVLAQAKAMTSEEDLSRWAEPFALLAGRVPEPDDLVKALVQENRPLGIRALATAQSLRVETLHEVLALSEQWHERAEVYHRLPELIGEPHRALAMIDQLRRRTRDGNDLYFLDTAAREVGRLFPDHAKEAEALLARFYAHIPEPPKALFQWVEKGGLGERGNDSDRIRRKMRITPPFHDGVVVVTNAQYAAFDQNHNSPDLNHYPVVDITCFEALSFCRWLSFYFLWAREPTGSSLGELTPSLWMESYEVQEGGVSVVDRCMMRDWSDAIGGSLTGWRDWLQDFELEFENIRMTVPSSPGSRHSETTLNSRPGARSFPEPRT